MVDLACTSLREGGGRGLKPQLFYFSFAYKLVIIFFYMFLFLSCKKDPAVWTINNLNGNKISAFGHGGMGITYRYPMNSFESLTKVLDLGADGTEMDVQLTRDNVLVLYHSSKLQDDTDCDGLIRNKNWSELQSCKYHTPVFKNAGLIRASDFFAKLSANSYTFTFDCRVQINDDVEFMTRYTDALSKLIEKYAIIDRSFIESYSAAFLKMLYEKNNNFKLFVHPNDLAAGLEVAKQVKLYGITIDRENITKQEIAFAHSNNLRVALFNADTQRENLAAIQMSPDIIQTDDMSYLVKVLSKE